MLWEEWITSVAESMNLDVASAALLMSLVFTVSLVLLALLATRGKSNLGIMLVGYGSIIFFTVLGWMPIFVVLLLVLITAGLFAGKIRDWFGGGSR
jgi:ABC-type polysaccharide/polyol phosphate export permease